MNVNTNIWSAFIKVSVSQQNNLPPENSWRSGIFTVIVYEKLKNYLKINEKN